jgi:integrase
VLQWSEAAKHPPVAGLGRDRIEKFLALFDGRPTTKRHVKIVLKMLLDHAVAVNWRTDNPAAAITVKAPKTKVSIWEAADVEFYMWACAVAGHPAIAAMILTEWEIGQRLTDVRLFRNGGEYSDNEGVFRFWQSKTESYVTIPVSERLQHMLRAIREPGLYLFVDPANGRPYAEQRLGHLFADIRQRAQVGRKLQLRALRHSCVVQLARAGCTVPEIAAITGHSPYSVEQILQRYLPRDNQVAWNAQQKRGLILSSAMNVAGTGV